MSYFSLFCEAKCHFFRNLSYNEQRNFSPCFAEKNTISLEIYPLAGSGISLLTLTANIIDVSTNNFAKV